MTNIFISVFHFFQNAIIFYMAAINLIYFCLTVTGFFVLRRYRPLTRQQKAAMMKSPLVPGISIIAPAHNEAATVRESVRGLLSLRYPSMEVIVVNDGSTDDTLQILIDDFRLYKSSRMPTGGLTSQSVRGVYESRDPVPLVVIDKENGRKADAINAGINYARMPLIMDLDCDSLLDPDALLEVSRPFLEDPERVIASGGIVRVLNGSEVRHGRVVQARSPSNGRALFQAVEYLRAFLGGRLAWSHLNSLLVISGAFGCFRRDALIEAGGYQSGSIGEDMELVVRLHKKWLEKPADYRIVFVPEPVCWTEVPEDWRSLRNQRNRWQRGTVDVIQRHSRMCLRPSYGAVGMLAMPYLILFEMFGPAVELMGYALIAVGLLAGLTTAETVTLYLIVSLLFGILLSMLAVLLDDFTVRRYASWRDTARLFAGAILENFGHRQALTIVRAKGLWDGLRGIGGWGHMHRKGF